MAKAEMKLKINTKQAEKTLQEMIKKHEDKIKEKIAFSLFCMFYYKHRFVFEQDEYLIKMTFDELKQIWELGKQKKKLKKFFDLAEQVFKIDLDDSCKEGSKNDNR